MTKAEVAQLLTIIAAFDRRTIGEADVEAWHLVVGDLDAADCAEAVRTYFTDSREWLMPADVRKLAIAAERNREGLRRLAQRDAEIAAENGGDPDRKAITAGGPAPEVSQAMRRSILEGKARRQAREAQAEAERRAHLAQREATLAQHKEIS